MDPQQDPTERAAGLFRLVRDYAALRSRPRTDIAKEEAHRWFADLPGGDGCRVSLFGTGADDDGPPGDLAFLTLDKRVAPPCPQAPADLAPWLDADWPFVPETAPGLLDALRGSGDDEVAAATPARDEPEVAAAHGEDHPETETGDSDAFGLDDDGDRDRDGDLARSLGDGSDDAAPGAGAAAADPPPPAGPPPEIVEAHARFIETSWTPWAEARAAWTNYDTIYTEVFAMAKALERRAEDLELVIGIGLLAWTPPDADPVRRHLIAVPATIAFDAETGRLSVAPADDPPRGESDMLPSAERPANWSAAVIEAGDALGDAPIDAAAVDRLLSAVANGLGGGRGTWSASDARPEAPGERPRVTRSPALVLRRRGRGPIVERADAIVQQLEAGVDVPAVVRHIVGAAPAPDPGAGPDTATSAAPAIPLLPLPANAEQRLIVDRLETSSGVLVQGPPGTGKSHGIANLICHLLATGRRVLVTAQSPRALAVLRDKLPASIRPLSIALLGSDGTALKELEASVATIVERCEEDPSIDERRATEAEARRATLVAEIDAIEAALVDRRLERQRPVTIGDTVYRGTPEAIARAVATDAPEHTWFGARGVGPDDALPAEAGALDEALAELRAIGSVRRGELASAALPDPFHLPEVGLVRDRLETERTAAARLEVLAATSPEGPDPDDLDPETSEALAAALSDLLVLRGELESAATSADWIGRAVDAVLRGEGDAWRERLQISREHADEIAASIGPVEDRAITVPDDVDRTALRADAGDLLRRLHRGGSVGPIARIFSPVVRRARYVIERVRVDGRACDRPETLEALLESLEVETRMRRLDAYLKDLVRSGDGPLRLRFAALRRCLEHLEQIAGLAERLETAKEAVRATAASWLLPPDWTDRAAVEGWRGSAARRLASAAVASARELVDETAETLDAVAAGPRAHPIAARLAEAVRGRDLTGWIAGRAELDGLVADAARLEAVETSLAGLPEPLAELARAIAADPEAEQWPDRLAALPAAWGHARARAWLDRLDDEDGPAERNRRLARVQRELETTTEELVGARAWMHARRALDGEARRTLQAWVLANRNLGRGTGRYAGRRRRAARELLERCRTAVPAWIMPLYRVFEQVDPSPGAFDAVVVDEASQCGLESLALTWLSDRLIVVGDDEQISPTVIIEREPLYGLSRKHLGRDPLAAVIEPETSLFDLGRVWFDDPIRLREHFRCMPEIIGFSDRVAYDGDLVPLRQAPPDRPEPVRTVHVPGGVRIVKSGDVINPPEAAAMVGAIAACHEDPAYEGMSFGVISLLGERQATLVESMLAQRIGPEAMDRRRMVCGDAYSFQGDERDVMFLGLVAANRDGVGEPVRVAPLVRRDARQRFNVAASRACDQLWLFHSVTLDDLTNPDDMRRQLLEYCLAPTGPVPEEVPDDEALAAQVDGRDRERDLPPPPFASWLAVDVYRSLRARGHRVLPSHDVAGGRIDLVVTDGRRMAAVACEGDERRTREVIEGLLARRRRLERCGWRYFDVTGTRFHLDAEQALADLWAGLDRLGLAPDPADSADAADAADVAGAAADGPAADGGANR